MLVLAGCISLESSVSKRWKQSEIEGKGIGLGIGKAGRLSEIGW